MSDLLSQLNARCRRWVPLLLVPTWYLTVIPEVQSVIQSANGEPVEVRDACKATIYDFFEKRLAKGKIALGHKSRSMDGDRKPIDTVVIHHTSNPRGLRPSRLSAIELIRLYGPYFAQPESEKNRHFTGQAIASGHVRNGQQVFWPYHWIIRRDGHAERLLYDSEIGWHAGDWDINCRSVAIVFDGDYEHRRPSDAELKGTAALIRSHYGYVSQTHIIGHREVNSRTTCPSELFIDVAGRVGWKSDLLALLRV